MSITINEDDIKKVRDELINNLNSFKKEAQEALEELNRKIEDYTNAQKFAIIHRKFLGLSERQEFLAQIELAQNELKTAFDKVIEQEENYKNYFIPLEK